MGLRNIKFKNTYRSFSDNIVLDFLVPALSESKTYWRGTGFFTMSGLSSFLDSILQVISNEGDVRIMTSPLLNKDDISRLETGGTLSDDEVLRLLVSQTQVPQEDKLKAEIITKLITLNLIQLRIAYLPTGIYHEKIGILKDDHDTVAFIGSFNETRTAQLGNYETIEVLNTWENYSSVQEHERFFLNIWNNQNEYLRVITFPEALKQKLIQEYQTDKELDELVERYKQKANKGKRELFDYQKQAIQLFRENNYSHFFEMATGTGKTFTAIKAILSMPQSNLYTIILVPQVDLQSQWERELKKEGVENIYLFGGLASGNWQHNLSKSKIDNKLGKRVISIAVYDTFFAKLYDQFDKVENVLLVVDEAHNISVNQIKNLPKSFSFRLGLSATPEKHDQDLTKKIVSYFTRDNVETFKFTIEDAINAGFLSRYKYYPIFVNLNEDEYERFCSLHHKLVQLINAKEKDPDAINTTANNRNNILKKAEAKLFKLEQMVEDRNNYSFRNSVIYCGRGKQGDSEDKIIDLTTKMLKQGNYDVSTFTSETENRAEVLRYFEEGYYDSLVAIQCFDEGIDVPKLEKIFIMSSDRLKRQTVQRRGRVLRKCKETGKTIAFIYDFVVLPPANAIKDSYASSLVKIEIERVNEYMRLSENKTDFQDTIQKLENDYETNKEVTLDEDAG